ncbi:hypothetical protein OKW24_005375 [Peribacillus simplex]|nr:hypothetical protein [Peribacillus simplex]
MKKKMCAVGRTFFVLVTKPYTLNLHSVSFKEATASSKNMRISSFTGYKPAEEE